MFDIGKQRLTAETRKALPGDFVRLSAGVTHYELRGEPNGRPVVLIHGNAAPLATWDNTIEDLCTAGFRVLRYDLFGHGFSDRPKLRRYDRGLYVTQLAELVSALSIPSPILVVGSSQGGSIAACFASEHPEKVGRLALVAPFFDTFEGSRSAAALLLRTPVIGELVVHLVGDRALTDLSDAMALPADGRAALEHEAGEQLRFRGKRRAILANLRGDALRNATSCYEALEERDIPIVLVWGSLDRKIAEESMQRLRDLLPAIEYHGFAGAGHLVHYEAPERLNPILVRFLAG